MSLRISTAATPEPAASRAKSTSASCGAQVLFIAKAGVMSAFPSCKNIGQHIVSVQPRKNLRTVRDQLQMALPVGTADPPCKPSSDGLSHQ
jgi:hypothetical protein